MFVRHVWTCVAMVGIFAIPAVSLTYQNAEAAGAPKAEWRSGKAAKTSPKAPSKAKALAQAPSASEPQETTPVPVPAGAAIDPADQSQEVLDIDFAMAASIASQGPKDGYASALSDEGILYDANGASPAGKAASAARFGSFPADVTLVRTPERALAAGGSGSSWGTYTIKRADAILSAGRYISVWRREASGWKMISELAAGKTYAAPPPNPVSGILPKRPAQLGRATPSPVGVPLTVPTPPATAPAVEPAAGTSPAP